MILIITAHKFISLTKKSLFFLELFMQIDEASFKKPFTIGSTRVNTHGTYVLAYSLLSEKTAIKAHGASQLVQYAQLDYSQDLCIISVNSIFNPIVALPFRITDNVVDANEWILLKNKNNWKNIFIDFMKKTLSNNQIEVPNNEKEVSKKGKKRKHQEK